MIAEHHPYTRPVSAWGIRWALAAIAALAAACSDPPAPEFPLEGTPNLIILGLDTLRADHLGLYGNQNVKTPHLDAFAEEAVVFERASATSTWTLPSFASLFTGQLPYEHGVVGGPYSRLSDDATTLAEVLRDAGYGTYAYVAVDYLTAAFALDQGFQHHQEFVAGPASIRSQLYQQQVLEFIESHRPEPFFLFAHYYDAHSPYKPPPPFGGMYYEGDPAAPEHDTLSRVLNAKVNRLWPSEEIYGWLEGIRDIQFPVREYAAGVTFLDHTIGTVLDALRRSGLLERSIVVIVSDHGEHLLEHYSNFYHRYPYEEVLHVPLMVRLPGAALARQRIPREVSLVDVFPTLVELLGLDVKVRFDGISLADAMAGHAEIPERLLFAEFGSRPLRMAKAVWDSNYRLIVFRDSEWGWAELYDRQADPAETRDLADSLPAVRARLQRVVEERFSPKHPILARPAKAAPPVSPEVRERLRALGYQD